MDTVLGMKLDQMEVRYKEKYFDLEVEDILVVTRVVEIPLVKYLGAKHMFLVLKLKNKRLIINHISDGDGGKGAKIVFENLPYDEIDDDECPVIYHKHLNHRVTLRDFIQLAEEYQMEYPNYSIHSKNCQFYCIQMLKKLNLEYQSVSSQSNQNMLDTTMKFMVVGLALSLLGLMGYEIYQNYKQKGKKEKKDIPQ